MQYKIFLVNILNTFFVPKSMRDQENPNKIESCVKLSQIVNFFNWTGCGDKFDAIPDAPVRLQEDGFLPFHVVETPD